MEEQCYALLIDEDNVSAKYIKPILTNTGLLHTKEYMETGPARSIRAGRMNF